MITRRCAFRFTVEPATTQEVVATAPIKSPFAYGSMAFTTHGGKLGVTYHSGSKSLKVRTLRLVHPLKMASTLRFA